MIPLAYYSAARIPSSRMRRTRQQENTTTTAEVVTADLPNDTLALSPLRPWTFNDWTKASHRKKIITTSIQVSFITANLCLLAFLVTAFVQLQRDRGYFALFPSTPDPHQTPLDLSCASKMLTWVRAFFGVCIFTKVGLGIALTADTLVRACDRGSDSHPACHSKCIQYSMAPIGRNLVSFIKPSLPFALSFKIFWILCGSVALADFRNCHLSDAQTDQRVKDAEHILLNRITHFWVVMLLLYLTASVLLLVGTLICTKSAALSPMLFIHQLRLEQDIAPNPPAFVGDREPSFPNLQPEDENNNPQVSTDQPFRRHPTRPPPPPGRMLSQERQIIRQQRIQALLREQQRNQPCGLSARPHDMCIWLAAVQASDSRSGHGRQRASETARGVSTTDFETLPSFKYSEMFGPQPQEGSSSKEKLAHKTSAAVTSSSCRRKLCCMKGSENEGAPDSSPTPALSLTITDVESRAVEEQSPVVLSATSVVQQEDPHLGASPAQAPRSETPAATSDEASRADPPPVARARVERSASSSNTQRIITRIKNPFLVLHPKLYYVLLFLSYVVISVTDLLNPFECCGGVDENAEMGGVGSSPLEDQLNIAISNILYLYSLQYLRSRACLQAIRGWFKRLRSSAGHETEEGSVPVSPRTDLRTHRTQMRKLSAREKKLLVDELTSRRTSSSDICCICFTEYRPNDVLVVLSCEPAHFFHKDCAQTWLTRHSSCPLCRSNLRSQPS